MKAVLFSFLALLLVAVTASAADKIRVSSFSTILTEIAEQVGGDRVAVTGHVKPGVDPHEFEPKPEDLKIVGDAQLILLSAKHMESYVGKLKEATGTKGDMVEVGDGFASLKMESEKDPGKTIDDPHWWQSVLNTEKAVKIVRDELIKVSPADKAAFTENAAKYVAKLDELEKWVKLTLAKLPRDKRKLVTSHDAFQYFAKENGFTIHAIEGVSSEDQPSSKKVGDIIAAIKSEGVKAIFPESLENPKVMTEIMRETGVKVAPALYADGLGESGDVATYVGMYKHNVSTIVEALK
jgi:ABC-type Zn uptake system ZnuABC Zn-binding protein ZnuA